ncbi:MAG: hypothetical protein GY847_15315 [Proteobacteria bacterium]|nr:hypothetical protein [Pseudomonadota bacterium]
MYGCGDKDSGPGDDEGDTDSTSDSESNQDIDVNDDTDIDHYDTLISGIDGIVVKATWAHLQPEQGGEIIENNIIDQAVEEVRAWNEKNPDKPDKKLYLGRFWTAAYKEVWDDFRAKLAAKYDSKVDYPEIVSVSFSRCMTKFTETMMRQK